jgi:DNA excision repair protein ERCC-1
MPWEYGDIPADYVLGVTTCALFLSLKYHRLHPEYIYTRIKGLHGKYALRIVLVMVDISNHEESLKELSKTSLINNVTLILTWSSAECARYIELFKTYEHAPPTSIKQHQSNKYSDRMNDFVTTPRRINKADAISLVSQFGSLRTAVNARHEDVAGIAGWGDVKVKAWTGAVREGFRTARAKKRRIEERPLPLIGGEESIGSMDGTPKEASRPASAMDGDRRPSSRQVQPVQANDEEDAFRDEEEALAAMNAMESSSSRKAPSSNALEVPKKRKPDDDPLSDGVMAALSKLRKDGG